MKMLINKYFDKLDIDGVISYNMVNSIIGTLMVNDMGVDDYSDITINGAKNSIKLNAELASVTGLNIRITQNNQTTTYNVEDSP